MGKEDDEIMEWDLYGLLGVEKGVGKKEIKTGYKQQALEWHPDKRPDDPTASERFQKISKAYAVLTDKDKKEQYDCKLATARAAHDRVEEQDAVRKSFRKRLEKQEQEAKQEKKEDLAKRAQTQTKFFLDEIMKSTAFKQGQSVSKVETTKKKDPSSSAIPEPKRQKMGTTDATSNACVVVKWNKSKKSGAEVSECWLKDLLSKCGEVLHMIYYEDRRKAFVVFASQEQAEVATAAMDAQCGLSVSLLKGKESRDEEGEEKQSKTHSQQPPPQPEQSKPSSNTNTSDYEMETFKRMRELAKAKAAAAASIASVQP